MAKKKKKPLVKPAKVGPGYLRKQKGKAGYIYLSKHELANDPEIVLNYKAKWRLSNKDPFSASMYGKEALNYFRKNLPKDTQQANRARVGLTKTEKYENRIPKPGELVFFSYADPVHKKTLPYYDIWPLSFVLGYWTTKDGNKIMSGLNLHYLPPVMRQVIFNKLLEVKTGKRYSKYKPHEKLKISWQIVKGMSEAMASAMIHSYRLDHVTGWFKIIPATSWGVVTFLPMAKFMKKSNQYVWRDSMKKIKKKK